MSRWEECWRFETKRFVVVFEIAPCEDDPVDRFEFEDDIELVRSGCVEWFDARVRVLLDGCEVAADYLGGCAYATVREFYTAHREPDAMNRNCSAMRAVRGNVSICRYFPSMVSAAVSEARERLRGMPRLRA